MYCILFVHYIDKCSVQPVHKIIEFCILIYYFIQMAMAKQYYILFSKYFINFPRIPPTAYDVN